MQRRSFLKMLAVTACSVAAGIDFVLPKLAKPQRLINGIHPEWLFAEFKPEHCFSPSWIRGWDPVNYMGDFKYIVMR